MSKLRGQGAGNNRGGRFGAKRSLCIFCVAFIFLAAYYLSAYVPRRSPLWASHTSETRALMQIKEIAPHFGNEFERIFDGESRVNANARDSVIRLDEWLTGNKYPKISAFLESLSYADIRALYDYFATPRAVGSSETLPLFEIEQNPSKQMTALALPVRGEWAVRDYLAVDGASETTTLQFMARSPLGSKQGTPKAHAPGDGKIMRIEIREPLPGELNGGENFSIVEYNLGQKELCAIDCVMASPEKEEFKQGEAFGVMCAEGSGYVMRFDFIVRRKELTGALRPEFSSYFVRGAGEELFRFAPRGVLQPGDSVMDAETYMANKRR